jgi:DNA-binding HxlR family transcriptional regulator
MKIAQPESCHLESALKMVVGKWKTIILWYLSSGTKRYGELKKLIPRASEKMLIQALRALEADRLVNRKVYPVIPPKVEYSLTTKGKSLNKILCSLDAWGKKHK